MQLFGSLWWDGAQDCFMGLRGGFEKHCTRASLRSDTVEDLIRISVEGPSLEDVDARESVASWFSRGQRSRKLNYSIILHMSLSVIAFTCDCMSGDLMGQ